MDMGVVGVPMMDRNLVETGAEVALGDCEHEGTMATGAKSAV
jgi:hypothetical protein